MRYAFFGRKIPHHGKTLWEIVANLKNFGVGRLVRKSGTLSDPRLSFCKILKVVPIPPRDKPFYNRVVAVWFEEIHKGKKYGVVQAVKNTDLPKYHLIPKIEEEEYLKRAEELSVDVKYVKKYCPWPPLYKELWEQQYSKGTSNTIPKLKLKISEYKNSEIIVEEGEVPKLSSSLYKTEVSVDEMYREIVKLKKLIKSSEAKEQ